MISQREDSNGETQRHSDFSIEHILKRAGNNFEKNIAKNISDESCEVTSRTNFENFQWLQCSRYCPPKVPRINKKESTQKRQLGRHPRIPFTSTQLSILEQQFQESPYLSSDEVVSLSQKLQLADIRVKIWFQNRRARERREKNTSFGNTSETKSHNRNENAEKRNTNSVKTEIKLETDQETNSLSTSDISVRLPTCSSLYNFVPNSSANSQSIPFFIPFVTYSSLSRFSPD